MKLKNKLIFFVEIILLYGILINTGLPTIVIDKYNHIYEKNDCHIYENMSPTEILNYFNNKNNFIKFEAGYFLSSCKNKNSSLFIYNNFKLSEQSLKNPLDILGLQIQVYNNSIFVRNRINNQLENIFNNTSKINYFNLNSDKQKNIIEKYWPTKIKQEINVNVTPVVLKF